MSGSADSKVFVWDSSKVGEEQARHDYEDGPPELVFPHETHQNNIEDLCWSPFTEDEQYYAVSVDTDSYMQIWRMSQDFTDDDET
jgi:histone-binding protein RBBP4